MRASHQIVLRVAVLALFCGAALAQLVGTLSGEIVPTPGEPQVPSLVLVRLSGFDYDQTTHAVSGRFSFHGVRSGNYTITVSAQGRRTVTTEIGDWSPSGVSGVTVEIGNRIADRQVDLNHTVVDVKTLKVPDSARKELAKANEFQEKAEYDKALEHIEKALKIHPGYYQAHNNKGVVYSRMNRLDEAEQAFAESVELQPESLLSQKNLGLLRLSRGKHSEAIAPLSKAATLDPNDAETKSYLGEAMFLEGRIEEARDLLEAALILKPDIEAANYRLGHIYMEAGHFDEALKFFRYYLKNNSGKAADEVRAVVAQLENRVKYGAE